MGSITLSRNGSSITLTDNLGVQRRVGRPGAELRPAPSTHPNYVDKARSASDIWIITGTFTSSSAESDARTLQETILLTPLGRDDLTLTFDNSLFGLSSYTVVPNGSQAGRISYSAGETGIVRVDTLELRVVNNA